MRDFFVASDAQLLLHRHDLIIFAANFVGQTLASTGGNSRLIIAIFSAQRDHFLGKVVPLILQGGKTPQATHLLRVIGNQLVQAFEFSHHPRLGDFIGVEKVLITGEQKAAHARFHVDGQPERMIGVVDHAVGVFDPLDHRQ